MAFVQSSLDVLGQRWDMLFGGVEQQRLQTDMCDVVGEVKVVEDAELIVLFEDGGSLTGRTTQCLLLLHIVGEFAEGLYLLDYASTTYRQQM